MKKINQRLIHLLTIVLTLSLMYSMLTINICAYSETGHAGFSSITFIEGGKLLKDISKEEIEEGKERIAGAKFWGYKTYFYNIDKKANYIGQVIFSKANRTSASYVVNYKMEESTSNQNSVQVSGSLSAKAVASIKKINTTITGEADVGIVTNNKNTITHTEETDIKININPYTKVTLRVSGEVYVTNATSKYYILGICFKSGEWEQLDVATYYYELVEEKLER